jgi:Type II secretory pathway, ATPase PulE/Tfp pilus assembly pathway, ATPase PilB
LATEAQFDDCASEAAQKNRRLEDVLIERKVVDGEQLSKLKAYILGIPFVNLEKENIPDAVLNLIPEPIARANSIVAFRKTADTLEVAMLDPEDLRIIESIKKTTGLTVLPRLTDPQGMKNAILRYQKTLMAEVGDLVGEPGAQADGSGEALKMTGAETGKPREDDDELKKVAQDLPVIRIIDTLVKHAIMERASDIHIEPTEKQIIVRYRIDGILRDAMTLPKAAAAGIVARIKVLSNLKLDECRLPQDGRFKVESDQWKYSLRVSTLPVYYGEKNCDAPSFRKLKGFSFGKTWVSRCRFAKDQELAAQDHGDDPDDRADRIGQNHNAVFDDGYFKRAGGEHFNRRRSDRIPDAAHQPNPG